MSRVDMYGGARAKENRGKEPKGLVNYAPVSNDSTRCDGCKHFQPPDSCEDVMGEIAPGGWCKLWVKRG
jgi:hypothetical protein